MSGRPYGVTSRSSAEEAEDAEEAGKAEKAEAVALRETLQRVGSGFEFAFHGVAADVEEVGEAHHRAVLRLLCDEIAADAGRYCQEAIARDPSLAAAFGSPLAFDVGAARATPLDASAVVGAESFAPLHRIAHTRDPATVSWFEWFCAAFGDPPYTLHVADEAERTQLFPRFCRCTGLLPAEGIVALDWVGDPEREPERSMWSDYFDAGKEWWGIWCFTVWNPRRRTLAAVMASQTD